MANRGSKEKEKSRTSRMFPDVSDERRRIMAAVKQKHTAPEMIVRSILHRLGYRFTINGKLNRTLPGKPDLVLSKWKTVIFVHGCFWHGHEECNKFKKTKTRTEFWENKIMRNRERDIAVLLALKERNWHAVVVWECEVNSKERAKAFSEKFKLSLPR